MYSCAGHEIVIDALSHPVDLVRVGCFIYLSQPSALFGVVDKL